MSSGKVPIRVLTITLILRIAWGKVVTIVTSVLLSGAFKSAVSPLSGSSKGTSGLTLAHNTLIFSILASWVPPLCWMEWAAVARCNGALCSALVPSREARRKREVLSLGYHGNVVDLW